MGKGLAQKLKRMNIGRVLSLIFITLCAAALLVRALKGMDGVHRAVPQDFEIILKARDVVFQNGDPYAHHEGIHTFKYSPVILVFLRALPLDHLQAWKVFIIFSVFVWWLAIWTSFAPRRSRDGILLFIGMGISWKGMIETLGYGQFEFLIFASILGAAVVARTRPVYAGLILGVLPWLKLPWILAFLPFLLCISENGRRALGEYLSGYCFALFACGAALPSLAFGSDQSLWLSQRWFETLSSQPKELFVDPHNQSVFASILRGLMGFPATESLGAIPVQLERLAYGFTCVILSILFGRLLVQKGKPDKDEAPSSWISPWILFVQLANPLGWRWASLYLVTLPKTLETSYARGWRWWQWMLLGVGVLLFLIQQNPLLWQVGVEHWTVFHRYGSLTLFWMVLLVLSYGGVEKNSSNKSLK